MIASPLCSFPIGQCAGSFFSKKEVLKESPTGWSRNASAAQRFSVDGSYFIKQ